MSTVTTVSGLQPVSKAAAFLSLSRSKIYQLMDQGQLKYVKVGRARRVRWDDVLAFVDRHTIGGEDN